MRRLVIGNAFSLSMFQLYKKIKLIIEEISTSEVQELLSSSSNFLSIIGHESTARLLSYLLNYNIPFNRVNYVFEENDILIVFQLLQRLEEGKVLDDNEIQKLFEQGKAKFYKIQKT